MKKNQIVNNLSRFWYNNLRNSVIFHKKGKPNSFLLFFFEKQSNLNFQKKKFDSYKNLIQEYPDVSTIL